MARNDRRSRRLQDLQMMQLMGQLMQQFGPQDDLRTQLMEEELYGRQDERQRQADLSPVQLQMLQEQLLGLQDVRPLNIEQLRGQTAAMNQATDQNRQLFGPQLQEARARGRVAEATVEDQIAQQLLNSLKMTADIGQTEAQTQHLGELTQTARENREVDQSLKGARTAGILANSLGWLPGVDVRALMKNQAGFDLPMLDKDGAPAPVTNPAQIFQSQYEAGGLPFTPEWGDLHAGELVQGMQQAPGHAWPQPFQQIQQAYQGPFQGTQEQQAALRKEAVRKLMMQLQQQP